MPLPDLMSAMESFQQALNAGDIQLRPGELDSDLYLHMDRPQGEIRLTYVRLQGDRVTAMVQFLPAEPYEGERCFSVGWAVPEKFRGRGRASEAFLAAIREMRNGFSRHPEFKGFWIEGVVGEENKASQKVAEKVISAPVQIGIDKNAGVPIFQYFRWIDGNTEI